MSQGIDRITEYSQYSRLFDRDKRFITAFGLQQSEKIYITATIIKQLSSNALSRTGGSILYVANDYISAQSITTQLCGLGVDAIYMPYKDEILLHRKSLSNDYVARMGNALYRLVSGVDVVVTCVESLCYTIEDKQTFCQGVFRLYQGQDVSVQSVIAKLIYCGYNRCESASNVGEFAVRGDILDVFLPSLDTPVRLLWNWDTLESIKTVGQDYVSVDELSGVVVYPLVDRVNSNLLEKAQRSAFAQQLDSNGRSRIDTILQELTTARHSYWLSCYNTRSRLLDYLGDNTIILWDEPKLLQARVNRIYQDFDNRFDGLLKLGEILPQHKDLIIPKSQVFATDKQFQISLQQLNYGGTFFNPKDIIGFTTSALYNYQYNIKQLYIDFEGWRKNGYKVHFYAINEEFAHALQNQLNLLGISVDVAGTSQHELNDALILPIPFDKGFISHSNKIVIVGNKDVGKSATTRQITPARKQVFLSFNAGDYVVHELHGIGLCQGITTLNGSWGTKDFVLVTYKHGDKLYVPVEASNLLTRFSGSDKAPMLSTIGGADFTRVKSRVKQKIKEMSFDLLKLYALREHKRGRKYNIDSYLCKSFDQSFEYTETPDQLTSIAEIDKDLSSDKIMDRLLVGDVGYGKTEVALRTAFKVITNGYQVAFLAPTTILSEQHYLTAFNRMKAFGIKIACLNRFRDATQQKQILKDLSSGNIDLVIGTHRLLSADVHFSKLGLLILDEEQRFGVEHKEKIKNIKADVDVLTMSATPIPRTLYMAISGIRDISTINTPPSKRIAVETYVTEENYTLIREAILREIMRDGQVFFVYNRVETIDYFAAKIRQLVPEASITVAHGQMDSEVLENAIFNFAQGNSNVLISTTIIENGIDMPNANTLIVYDADKLGLSQLYQLRGRVGRSDRLAYAYFVYRKDKVLDSDAYNRLSSIMQYNQLGSGFKIALADLEIRGAGNVLGAEQHGNMVKVGYDMYARLLSEAVSELKGVPQKRTIEATVDIDVSAYAPEHYIASSQQRMDFYQKSANCSTIQEVEQLRQEIVDIYGTPPIEVNNLLTVLSIKLLASGAGITQVVIKGKVAQLTFVNREYLLRECVFDALDREKNNAKLSSILPEITYSKSGNKLAFFGDLIALLQSIQQDGTGNTES